MSRSLPFVVISYLLLMFGRERWRWVKKSYTNSIPHYMHAFTDQVGSGARAVHVKWYTMHHSSVVLGASKLVKGKEAYAICMTPFDEHQYWELASIPTFGIPTDSHELLVWIILMGDRLTVLHHEFVTSRRSRVISSDGVRRLWDVHLNFTLFPRSINTWQKGLQHCTYPKSSTAMLITWFTR